MVPTATDPTKHEIDGHSAAVTLVNVRENSSIGKRSVSVEARRGQYSRGVFADTLFRVVLGERYVLSIESGS